jgi:hypothetical protein
MACSADNYVSREFLSVVFSLELLELLWSWKRGSLNLTHH